MRKKGYYTPYPLIVSTCFDRTLEQAFENAGEFYDLVSYVADQQGGRFAHQPPGEDPHPIEDPNAYQELSLKKCPVILKLYGGMGEDFVITEDHYIVWVYINDCLYRHSAIADYQAGHDVSQPLESLDAPHQRAVIKTVSEKIIEAIKTP